MITLYSKNNCPYCMMAKGFLTNNNFAYEEINIEEQPEAREFVITEGHRTMPQIYKDGKLLVSGGWVGLSELGVDGLTELLQTAVINPGDLGSI